MTSPGGVASAGAVALDVEPDARDFYPRLRAQVLPAADAVGRDIGRSMAAPIAAQIANAVPDAVRSAGRSAVVAARRAGESIGETMGRRIRARVEQALANMPDVRITADSSEVERKIAAVRRQLLELRDQRIRVDLDTESAIAKVQLLRNQLSGLARDVERIRHEGGSIDLRVDVLAAGAAITRLKAELQELRAAGSQDITINVDVDSAAAMAQIAQVTAAVEALAALRPTISVDMDTGAVMSQIAALTAAVEALSQIRPTIDVDADTGAAMANLAAVAAAAEALARLSPTITPRVNPGPAMAGLAGIGGASLVAGGGMQALIGVAVLLGPIIVPAAAAAAAALAAIGPAALAGVAGIGVMVLALSGVMGAVSALNAEQQASGQAAAQAAARQAQVAAAAERQRQATVALADAEKNARQAREDLTRAQEDARRAQEDLNISVKEGLLSQRAAALDLIDARAQLAATMADPRASEMEQKRAQLAYDQAKQRVESLAVRQKRLETDKAAADKAGVDGSQQVLAAREQIAMADRRVADAQRALVKAHQESGAAGASAANKVAQAMAPLSPEARRFSRFLVGLKDDFYRLRRAAEAGFLPGFQAGLEAMKPLLPHIEKFIGQVATAFGDLFKRAGKALNDPFWITFFDTLGQFAGPALESLGTILGQTAKGFAGLFQAFIPLSGKMLDGLAAMATGFAEWAAGLSKSDGFAKFIDYVTENGPLLMSLLGDLVIVVIKMGIALAPLGAIMLKGLAVLFEWLATLDPAVLLYIAAAVMGVIVAFTGGIPLVIGVIVALVGFLVYAWQHFEGFRNVVTAVVSAVATAAVWLWENALKPAFSAIAAFVMGTLIPAILWLWQNVIQPAFSGIAAVASWLWNNVLKPTFAAIWFVISEILAPVFLWLYRNVIAPVFTAIRVAISVAWAIIQVIFGLWQIAIKILARVFTWLWHNIIEPVWNGISGAIKWVWENAIRPILSALGGFIEDHVAPAFRRGVKLIETIWNGIRDVAKIPIKFVLETVLNNGLLAGYNRIAKMFGVKPDDVQIPLPKGFATGGHVSGMGGPTSDSVAAMLSAGEYVIPAHIVRRFGVRFFDWLIGKTLPATRSAVQPGDGSEGLAFAKGGFFGGLEDKWNKLKDPLGWVRGKVEGLIGAIPGAGALRDVVSGLAKTTLGGVLDWVKSKITNVFTGDYKGPVSDDVRSVQSWVQRQAGKPYVWAAVGPDGYDCSGMVGAAYNLMHGRAPHSRVFSTHNEAQFFPKPGRGVFTAGWAHAGERGGGSVGHTAANLAGLAFESRGSDGVVVGDRASDVTSFARMGTYDSGGWLLPGLTAAYNGTGEPERILTGPQWDQVQARLSRAEQGGGPLIGSLTLAPSSEAARDQMDEVAYALRRIRRGGVYA